MNTEIKMGDRVKVVGGFHKDHIFTGRVVDIDDMEIMVETDDVNPATGKFYRWGVFEGDQIEVLDATLETAEETEDREEKRTTRINEIIAERKAAIEATEGAATKEHHSNVIAMLEKAKSFGKRVRKGAKVRVIPHAVYQHLSGGASIEPMRQHWHDGYETTIRNIFKDVMEDEHGNPVAEISVEVATGEIFNLKQISLLD